MKKFSLISNLNLSWCNLGPFPLVPSPVTWEECKEDEVRLLGGAKQQDERQSAETGTQEVPFEKEFLYYEGNLALEQAPQRGCRVSSLEILENHLDTEHVLRDSA